MIVKILSPSPSFSGVRYNLSKVEANRAELMKVANFDALQGLSCLRTEDYVNYFKMIAAQKKSLTKPQFHAVLAANRRAQDKHALTGTACRWLAEMGYGGQPYLVVFHKDTRNNHVHMVSCRIGKQGHKIPDSFERLKATQSLQLATEPATTCGVENDIKRALNYKFSTIDQFALVLKAQGYKTRLVADKWEIIRFGRKQGEILLATIEARLRNYWPDVVRLRELRKIFEEFRGRYRTDVYPKKSLIAGGRSKETGFVTSAFAEFMKHQFGLILFFHDAGSSRAGDYTILDPESKAVWQGRQIMDFTALLSQGGPASFHYSAPEKLQDKTILQDDQISEEAKAYYAILLRAALDNGPDIQQGTRSLNISLYQQDEAYLLLDEQTGIVIPIKGFLTKDEIEEFMHLQHSIGGTARAFIPAAAIAQDVDDEKTYGAGRKKKWPAR